MVTEVKTNSAFAPVRLPWLALRREVAIEPNLHLVDSHHHLWDRAECPYLLPDFLSDVGGGHSVRDSVFVECRSHYRRDGERTTRSLGETEFAAAVGEESDKSPLPISVCAGIVGYVDLQALGDGVAPLLDKHMAAARGRFRGIRNLSATPERTSTTPSAHQPPGLLGSKGFREGFAHLASRSLTFDAWMFHTQLTELADLANSFPGTTIVLNHAGGPRGIGAYAERPKEAFEEWRRAIQEISSHSNVYLKLGGLGMPHCGFGFHEQPMPPSSEDLAAAWRPLIETCVEKFGPTRCMFESNFPVDKASYSYTVLWNAFKRITAGYSTNERHGLFFKTASTIYRLNASTIGAA